MIKNYRDIIDSGKRLEEALRLELISRGVYTSLWSNLSAAITEEDVKLTLRAAADAIEAVG